MHRWHTWLQNQKRTSRLPNHLRNNNQVQALKKHLIKFMGDHVVVNVETQKIPEPNEPKRDAKNSDRGKESLVSPVVESSGDESEPLIGIPTECRICQEEDLIKNLETPCACNGSLKHVHRACVQRWCNEKGDINCETYHQWGMGDKWEPAGSAGPTSSCNSRGIRALSRRRLMVLFLLRHTLSLDNGSDGDDDASTLFSLFLLKAARLLLPCYIMAWAISILQRQRFFFKSQVIGTNKLDINYAWVTKEELLEYFPEHSPLFDKMLINIK